MIAARAKNQRMRNAALRVQPLIGLLRQRGNAPLFEKFRRDSLRSRFIGDVLGAFFAKFEMRALAVGFGPGATGTIDALLLIQLQQRARSAHWAHLFESVFRRTQYGRQTACCFADWFDDWRRGLFGSLRLSRRKAVLAVCH